MSTYAEYISLFSQTWSKQSYGLLDYEAHNLNSQKLKIHASVYLQRKYNRLMISERRAEDKRGGEEETERREERRGRENERRKFIEKVCKEEKKEDQRSSDEDEKEEEEEEEEERMDDDQIESREKEENSRRKEVELQIMEKINEKEGVGKKEEEGKSRKKMNGEEMVRKRSGEKENLCKIVKIEESFFLGPWREGFKGGVEALWMVLGHKNYKREEDYILNERDVFKLGRMTFKVMNIKTEFNSTNSCSILDSVRSHYNNCGIPKKIATSLEDNRASVSGVACRFCLNDKFNEENPLITPCDCSGSMKFVHFKCLKTWVVKKISTRLKLDKKNGIISITWNGLSCELCKKGFPLTINHSGRDFDFLDLNQENNFKYYLVLESFNKNLKPAGIHYIDFSERQIIHMGRAETSDIKLIDISVSRNQASIFLEKNNFYLRDNASKFGTLVLVKRPRVIKEKKEFYQVGRTVFAPKIEKSWLRFFSFFQICTKREICETNTVLSKMKMFNQ